MAHFQFGAHAIVTPESETRFFERRSSILDSIKPSNIVESIFAEELLHASWDMERVRAASAQTAAEEPALNAAYSRASRNWHRSLKQLKNLQSSRASHICETDDNDVRELLKQCPLADLRKVPKPICIHVEPEIFAPDTDTDTDSASQTEVQ